MAKAQAAVPQPTAGIITLKRKVGYGEEDGEVYKTRRELVRLTIQDSMNVEQ